ncbi:tyrosine-type recombinase/integrase [Streptomyces sp. RPA4-5]|uniref:tyrosine-type recombinase/integrase n=1 Tax=Streptomyces sp. RPA4-5 TaxID=2721245 RepID=UPI00143E8501|nr:tyrosine-type recombinase/integrase [Streptomyces sp. RPA4-5]QIY58830.1 tyrosine-type recombinase/integrase [Streptomyces sp. RPA4-5]
MKAPKEHRAHYPGGPDDPVCVKGPMFTRCLWPKAVKDAGLPRKTGVHTLRHTYASLLILHGADPKAVAVRLGDTVAVALAIYAHLFPEEDQGTREAVEDFFGSAPNVPGPSPDEVKDQVIEPPSPDSGDPRVARIGQLDRIRSKDGDPGSY